MVSRKKKSATPKRRKPKASKPVKTKKKRASTAKPKIAHPAERQLAVYHNPFSSATTQPKIPDGKITQSLGMTSQTVGELIAANTTSTGAADNSGVMDILLFAGRNCGMLVRGDYAGQFPNKNTAGTAFTDLKSRYHAISFNDMNPFLAALDATGTGSLFAEEKYAYWRNVSTGLILSLLNPAEEDDGWWEAVRLSESKDSTNYGITQTDATVFGTRVACVPSEVLSETSTEVLSNQNSYTTGLLRDLKNHVFKLNPVLDDHDVTQVKNTFEMVPSYYNPAYGAPSEARGAHNSFATVGGSWETGALIESSVDKSFDMIYIRIHGRTSGNPTRLHFNVVGNQECAFQNDDRESRYHTKSHTVGNIREHTAAKKSNNSAAHLVPM